MTTTISILDFTLFCKICNSIFQFSELEIELVFEKNTEGENYMSIYHPLSSGAAYISTMICNISKIDSLNDNIKISITLPQKEFIDSLKLHNCDKNFAEIIYEKDADHIKINSKGGKKKISTKISLIREPDEKLIPDIDDNFTVKYETSDTLEFKSLLSKYKKHAVKTRIEIKGNEEITFSFEGLRISASSSFNENITNESGNNYNYLYITNVVSQFIDSALSDKLSFELTNEGLLKIRYILEYGDIYIILANAIEDEE